MDQIGFVTKTDKKKARVIVKRTTACGDKCNSCEGGCDVTGTVVDIDNTLNAKHGDYVEIEMATSSVMMSIFLVYVMPLILMIAGIGLGIGISESWGIDNQELLGLVLGALSLVISFFLLRIIDSKLKNKSGSQFKMMKILTNDIDSSN